MRGPFCEVLLRPSFLTIAASSPLPAVFSSPRALAVAALAVAWVLQVLALPQPKEESAAAADARSPEEAASAVELPAPE